MKVKEESEKVGLKLNIKKSKIMASDPITSWEIDGETVAAFILGGSKITAEGDCSHEIKRQHFKKQRHCFANKGLFSQGYDSSVPTELKYSFEEELKIDTMKYDLDTQVTSA